MAAAALAAVLLLAACGSDGDDTGLRPFPVRPTSLPDLTPPPDQGPIPSGIATDPRVGTRVAVFASQEDERTIVGRVFGFGRPTGVVLVHAPGEDMRSWFDAAGNLMDAGHAALPFDLRGTNQSEGPDDPVGYPEDVQGAIDFLVAGGTKEVVLVGVGGGGTAAVVAAAHSDHPVAGVVAVGSGPTHGSLDGRRDAERVSAPVLVLDTGAGGEQELASLIPDATLQQVDAGEGPTEARAVQERLMRFVERVLGGDR